MPAEHSKGDVVGSPARDCSNTVHAGVVIRGRLELWVDGRTVTLEAGDSFGFKSELLTSMYAVTDGFSGIHGTWSTPGTGMNFLDHNMCRLPGTDGTFTIVKGGMGVVTERIGAREVDGELVTAGHALTVAIAPSALTVRMPRR